MLSRDQLGTEREEKKETVATPEPNQNGSPGLLFLILEIHLLEALASLLMVFHLWVHVGWAWE